MHISTRVIRQLNTLDEAVREAFFLFAEDLEEQVRNELPTRDDFTALREIVADLAEAQKRTEARVEELAQAQKHTEERLDSLAIRVEELAQAQKRTECELKKLAKDVQELARSHKDLQKQVGGLSAAVGYGIEDQLMPFIPAFASKEYGIEITSVDRTYIEYPSGTFDEVNILARGRDDEGRPAYIVGECKAQPGKKDADRFAALLRRVGEVLDGTVHPLLIGYVFDPRTERYVRNTHPHIRCLKTYQIRAIAEGLHHHPPS